jgi:FMN-dependent NADH-azoreductase
MNTVNTARTLLHLDASPRAERSHSRRLGRKFLAHWRAAHPGAQVIERNLTEAPPPFVSEAWVEGAYLPADQHSPAAREAMALSDTYIGELATADEIVITTPIYNLSIPAVLKAWIDQIVRHGRTFVKTAAGGFEGLVRGKRVIVIVASGSDFRPGTPGGAYNFAEPYLRAVLGFIGVTQVEFVYAHSMNSPVVNRDDVLATAENELTALAV